MNSGLVYAFIQLNNIVKKKHSVVIGARHNGDHRHETKTKSISVRLLTWGIKAIAQNGLDQYNKSMANNTYLVITTKWHKLHV